MKILICILQNNIFCEKFALGFILLQQEILWDFGPQIDPESESEVKLRYN